jgi:hypothetical protein
VVWNGLEHHYTQARLREGAQVAHVCNAVDARKGKKMPEVYLLVKRMLPKGFAFRDSRHTSGYISPDSVANSSNVQAPPIFDHHGR